MPQWAWKHYWHTHVVVLFTASAEISFHSQYKSLLLKTKKLIEIKVSLNSLSKENHTSPKGIKIWRDQFDPENWMITKESDYSHCNMFTPDFGQVPAHISLIMPV